MIYDTDQAVHTVSEVIWLLNIRDTFSTRKARLGPLSPFRGWGESIASTDENFILMHGSEKQGLDNLILEIAKGWASFQIQSITEYDGPEPLVIDWTFIDTR
jgi:hypothetical protein